MNDVLIAMDEAIKKQRMKENAIRLAVDHARTCDREDCGISLSWVCRLLELAGIPLTPEERKAFL